MIDPEEEAHSERARYGQALPRVEAREKLIEALANLLRKAGWERFVTQPLILPSAEYFPDPWTPSERGAYRLTRRLLVYADLGEREVDIHVFRTTEGDTHRSARGESYPDGPEHAAATFHGITEKGFTFGVDVKYVADDETLAATMCHEVAHAFREHHDLMVTTRDTEEQLTDLTTVYLGFGVLTTNSAYSFRAKGGSNGLYAWGSIIHSRFGYLSAGDFAFLLAVQAVVRGGKGKLVRSIASNLEPNQAALFEEAIAELLPNRMQLLLDLGLPPEETWPPQRELASFLAPIDLANEVLFDADSPVRVTARAESKGTPVFRVRFRRLGLLSFIGAVVGSIITLASHASDGFYLVIGVALVGTLIGSRLKYYECSNADCTRRLRHEDDRCGYCGGSVKGTISSHQKRLDAREALDAGTFVSLD
jgi:hypothetical protein